ncbi:MAG: DUF4115 domain-containing protein [Acidaminococcaceae bacterium]|nr:DUF4115 domain-containing protein [Acidaminococcaceae bacterium]
MSQVGDFLKDVRVRKGLSINEVAEGTGIRTQYLEALENGDYSKIPGDVFIKGFIRNYGNFLDVDGNALVEEYKNQVSNASNKKSLTNPSMNMGKACKLLAEDKTKNTQKTAKNASCGRIKRAWLDIKDFIYDNIYETVEVDENEDEDDNEVDNSFATRVQKNTERKRLTNPTEAAASNKNSFFNGKVFVRVFAICLLIFVVFMSYFLLSSIKAFPKSTNIITALKNAISAELSSDKATKLDVSIKNVTAKEPVKIAKTKVPAPIEDKKDEVVASDNYTGNGVVVEITYKEPVWTQVSLDGKGVEANTVAKGVTKTYKANKEVKVTLGSIRNVEIKVNGNVVPYGEKEWGTVEKIFKK